jgi:hypothetical protein
MSQKNEYERFKRLSQESFQEAKRGILQHGIPAARQKASGCLVIIVLLFIIIIVVSIFR